MTTYKCGYCGETGQSSTPRRTPCLPGRSSHAWRPLSDRMTCAWSCRKCGAVTYDDQTPLPVEGGGCRAGSNHVWERQR